MLQQLIVGQLVKNQVILVLPEEDCHGEGEALDEGPGHESVELGLDDRGANLHRIKVDLSNICRLSPVFFTSLPSASRR